MNNHEFINENAFPKKDIFMNNFLQIELARRNLPKDELSDESLIKWINRYGSKFGNLIEEKSSENTNLWNDLKDKKFRENTLNELEQKIYESM